MHFEEVLPYDLIGLGLERTFFLVQTITFLSPAAFCKDLFWCNLKYFKINFILMKIELYSLMT